MNAEAGAVWLARAREQWPNAVWINPVAEPHWGWTQSIGMIREAFDGRMFAMTLEGITGAMRALG